MKRHVFGLATLALALLTGPYNSGQAAAAQANECPPGDTYVDCKAKAGDRMAIYVQGRNAYEAARSSGDFTQALETALQLAKQNDKNGERLLKMVYLQLGWGAHRDPVQAYIWLTQGMDAGNDYVAPLRKQLMEKMTPEQLAQAKQRTGQ
ncbi:MAG: hypothetical protein U1F68_07735 [Gammaproteobacteria bacterium]